jgi:ankyrin repeat protein
MNDEHNVYINAIQTILEYAGNNIYPKIQLHQKLDPNEIKMMHAIRSAGLTVISQDDSELLRLILESHPPQNMLQGFLMHAVSVGNIYMIRILLDQGVDVNTTDYDGNTPLHLAVKNYIDEYLSIDIIKLLFESGADPKIINVFGETPATYVLRLGYRDLDDFISYMEQFPEEYQKYSEDY